MVVVKLLGIIALGCALAAVTPAFAQQPMRRPQRPLNRIGPGSYRTRTIFQSSPPMAAS